MKHKDDTSILSCVWLFVTLWTIAHQSSQSIPFFPARILENVAISFSRVSSWLRDRTHVFCISYTARGFFTAATDKAQGKHRTLISWKSSITTLSSSLFFQNTWLQRERHMHPLIGHQRFLNRTQVWVLDTRKNFHPYPQIILRTQFSSCGLAESRLKKEI